MIKLDNISKEYENQFIALKKISLTICDGDFLAIIGKSGSGKSTLLNIIGLLDDYSSGSYYLNDKSVSTFREKELASLRMNNFGYVFQEYYLELEFTVYQNLRIPFIIKKNEKERI